MKCSMCKQEHAGQWRTCERCLANKRKHDIKRRAKAVCLNCSRKFRKCSATARGLCGTCYHKPSVKALFPTRKPQKLWTPFEKAKLRELVAARTPRPEIADKLNRSVSQIRGMMARLEIGYYWRPKGRAAKILPGWYNPDLHTDHDIAARLNVNVTSARRARIRLGLPRTRVKYLKRAYERKRQGIYQPAGHCYRSGVCDP